MLADCCVPQCREWGIETAVGQRRTKRREVMRGGGVNKATNRRTRDEGSDKEGEDGKGDGDTMVLAVMDGATLTA